MSVTHGTFTLERTYPVSPERVFSAWSDPKQIEIWAAPSDGWVFENETFDFTIGGTDLSRFGPKGEEPFVSLARFDDIVPNSRIVTAYSIAKGTTRISSSVTTVELIPDERGTVLRLTEQGAYFDGHDNPQTRRGGVLYQLDQLEAYFAPEVADAK
ncbi:SRPBCC family protein [Pelagibacterium limicola]|uniref:SRPBCC family protein n=1 Tax=Pelagibacterium limicola TaxID=2791022 RepID=UPI0018AF7E89|nr:SRPBCC family protein [Pelagibacterium limicola]